MQTDGNLVLYHKSDGRPLWSAKDEDGNDLYGSGATDVVMQGGEVVWLGQVSLGQVSFGEVR